MKRVLILSAAVLFCGVPLRAQVTKQVEVTKTYVPEVSKAVKLPIVPDMTDTVRLRPEIDYTVTPSATSITPATGPRSATISACALSRGGCTTAWAPRRASISAAVCSKANST